MLTKDSAVPLGRKDGVGCCHFLVLTTLAMSGLSHGIQKLSLSFILQELPFWCLPTVSNQTIKQQPTEKDPQVDQCKINNTQATSTIPCEA